MTILSGCGSGSSGPTAGISGSGNSGIAGSISQAQAQTIIEDQVISKLPDNKEARAYITPETLKPGDIITSGDDELGGESPITIDSETWLSMVDPNPLNLFAHDVLWVLVDAGSGDLQQFSRQWFPRVNGQALWVVSDERFDGPDQFFPATPPSGGSRIYGHGDDRKSMTSLTEEVIRAMPQETPRGGGVRKVGMVINGAFNNGEAQENGGDHTLALIANALSANGFEMQTDGEPNEYFADVNDADAPKKAAEKIKSVAAGLGPCDKFYIIILSHGATNGIQIGKKEGGFYYKPEETPADGICLSTLLAELPAGIINVTLLACYSGSAAGPLDVEMATHGNKGGVINYAAMSSRTAIDGGVNPQFGESGMPYGNDFAKDLADKAKNDLNGDGDVDIQEFEKAMKRAHDVGAGNFWVNLFGNNPGIDYFGSSSPW